MRKIILSAFAILLSTAMFAQVQNYAIGDTVDDFTVTDTDGVEWNLYDLTAQGKYVYLDFFFDTCGPCQTTQPIYNEFHDTYGCNEFEIFVISINNGTDNDEEVIAFENTFGGDFQHSPAVSSDGGSDAVDANFGITAYPTYCMVGPDNTLVENDIWPIADVSTYEATIPAESNATPMACSLGLGDTAVLDFTMYPNPSNGSLVHLDLPVAMDDAKVTIYNTLGSVVFAQSFNGERAALETNLSAGAYLVKVTGGDIANTLMLKVQ
jgi:thiol-disulfide isomerase/thioredoxin